MSIFIALLSFQKPQYHNEAKFAILSASVLAGISGYLLLSTYNKWQRQKAGK